MAHLSDTEAKTTQATETIARQHEQLKVLVTSLPTTKDLALLVARLKELRDGLEAHFVLEEGPDGFHDIVLHRAPRHHTRVQRLFDEHRDFLRRIDSISSMALACLEGPAKEVFREVDLFTQALEKHETRENEMLGDAMYSDTGFGE